MAMHGNPLCIGWVGYAKYLHFMRQNEEIKHLVLKVENLQGKKYQQKSLSTTESAGDPLNHLLLSCFVRASH